MRVATALVAVMVMSMNVAAAAAQAPVTPGVPPSQVVPPATGAPAPQAPTVPPPAPALLEFGCPMGLEVIQNENDLIAEIVHPRLTYKEDHLAKLGYVMTGLPDPGFAEMRNAQLWALRIVANRLDYGIEL